MQEQSADGFALSPVQERLYGISKGASAFQGQIALSIDGPLDTSRLQTAINTVITQTEILRTNFQLLAGRRHLLQVVNPAPLKILTHVDLSRERLDAQNAQIDRFFSDNLDQPLKLDKDALCRFYLFTLDTNRYLLSLTISSLCADAASLTIVMEDVLRAYQELDSVESEPIQYADISAFQSELLQSDEDEAQLGRQYWLEQASSLVPIQKLPYEHLSVGSTYQPERIGLQFVLPQSRNTSQAFLAACWISLLFRLTNQDTGVLGWSVNGRTYEELANAPGLFAKTVPVSWHIQADMPLAEFVSQLTGAIEDANRNQDFYRPDGTDWSLGFAVEPRFAARLIDNTNFTLAHHSSYIDQFGLNLVVQSLEEKIVAELQFDSRRFRKDDMARLAEQFQTLTMAAAVDQSAKIGDLPLLSQAERHQILTEWNATDVPYPDNACIHHLFEQQVERIPKATALVCGDERLTFEELNRRANQIAHFLRSNGVSANQPVGLCLERSASMIVGLLAILKAGGFYVPLAADLPSVRLKTFLDTTQTSLVLTQQHLKDAFQGWDGTLICLDTQSSDWGALSQENPKHENTPDDLVYAIFTSGSTGIPKAVGCRHRGIVNYVTAIAAQTGLADGQAQWHLGTVSTLSADLGNTAVFPSLAYGGCLHVIGLETAMDGELFSNYTKANPLDLLKITPSHLRALLATTNADILPNKTLFVGGEALTWDLLDQVQQRSTCRVINHYGPTETTVGSLTYDTSVGHIGPNDSATVPIGRPIANTKILILDASGQLVPVGIAGELYIGGSGVAAGYLNQPEQTQERFVVIQNTELMYRTGDRARYLANSSVEFLGRVDDQVKIRGFRVEPGEIESVIRRHPGVHAASVLVTDDSQGAKRLAGYYVGRMPEPPSVEQLRAYLAEQLPDYMIPSSLTVLSELPLTPNGKIDRKALLALETVVDTPTYQAPRNTTEEKLAEIWSQTLKVDQIGIHDNFFALGGHSLLMTQIIARIRTVFQVPLALHTLFDHPTIAEFATLIDHAQMSQSDDNDSELDRLLAELEGLTEEEAQRLLNEEQGV